MSSLTLSIILLRNKIQLVLRLEQLLHQLFSFHCRLLLWWWLVLCQLVEKCAQSNNPVNSAHNPILYTVITELENTWLTEHHSQSISCACLFWQTQRISAHEATVPEPHVFLSLHWQSSFTIGKRHAGSQDILVQWLAALSCPIQLTVD